jgi:hypothetical protein
VNGSVLVHGRKVRYREGKFEEMKIERGSVGGVEQIPRASQRTYLTKSQVRNLGKRFYSKYYVLLVAVQICRDHV